MTLSAFTVGHVHSSWHSCCWGCCWAGAIEGIAISPASTTFFSIVASPDCRPRLNEFDARGQIPSCSNYRNKGVTRLSKVIFTVSYWRVFCGKPSQLDLRPMNKTQLL
jgi:hypothetical protein